MYRTSDKALMAAATILWQAQEPPMEYLTVEQLLRQGAEVNDAGAILLSGKVEWLNGVLVSDLIAVAVELIDTAIEDRMTQVQPVGFRATWEDKDNMGFKATWQDTNSITVVMDMLD